MSFVLAERFLELIEQEEQQAQRLLGNLPGAVLPWARSLQAADEHPEEFLSDEQIRDELPDRGVLGLTEILQRIGNQDSQQSPGELAATMQHTAEGVSRLVQLIEVTQLRGGREGTFC